MKVARCFFFKASILGFHGFRRPNTNGSQFFLCTVAVGLRRFFFVWPYVVPKQLRSKFSAQTGGNSPLERQTRGFWQGTLSKRGKRGQLSVFSVLLSRKMQNGILSLKIWHEPIQSATQAQDHELQVKLQDLFFLSNSVGFGVFSHSKGLRANWHVWGSFGQVGSSALAEVLGQTDMLAFWDSLGQMALPPKRFFWGFTKASLMRFSEAKALEHSLTILYMRLPVSQSFCGVKGAWIVDLQHLHSAEKTIDHVVAATVVCEATYP